MAEDKIFFVPVILSATCTYAIHAQNVEEAMTKVLPNGPLVFSEVSVSIKKSNVIDMTTKLEGVQSLSMERMEQ